MDPNNTTSNLSDFDKDVCLLNSEPEDIHLDLRYVIYGPLLFFVIVFGLFGNILNFLIFQNRFGSDRRQRQCQQQQQQRMRIRVPKMHRYLAVLSVWDSLLIVASFFLYNLPYLMYGKVRMYGAYVRIYPYAYAMACASRTGGIWILIASALDRYFAVCHPFAHHVYSTTRRTNVVLTACCVLSLFYGWPRYYHIILEDCFDIITMRWTVVALGSDIRASKVYWYVYKIGADFVLVSVGPFVILFGLSLAVGLAVRRSSRARRLTNKRGDATPATGASASTLNFERAESSTTLQRTIRRASAMTISLVGDEDNTGNLPRSDSFIPSMMRRHERSQRRRSYQEGQQTLNFMMVAVLAKFLVCHSLPAVLDVCETMMDPQAFQTTRMDDLVHAANTLVIFNGSLNIVLYLLCSRRFRNGVVQALFDGLKRQHSRSTLGSTQSTPRENTRS